MPQQFVQLASGSPDYSNLLNQTQTVAQREHAVAMRKATQAALLQQLADRGQLQGLQDGDVKIGRHGIETSSPEAAERWRQAQAPTTESLSKDIQGYVTQTVVDKSEDLAQKSGAAAVAINAALNPNQAEHEAITMAMARNSYAQSQGMIDDNARDWARDGQVRGPQPSETPQQRREAALGAMGALIGMNRQQQPDTSGGPQPGQGQGYDILRPGNTATAPGTTPPPSYSEKHQEKDKKGETRSGRDMIKTSLDNTNFKIETTDRIRTESDAGLRFHDDIRESLPSLRKAATIEAISSMFSGTPSPGQFNQLAEQRERDLVEYNKRFDAQGKKVAYTGGNTNITTTGGKSAAEAADSRFGSSTTEIHNNNSATGNRDGGPGQNQKVIQMQVQDANGQDTSLSFDEKTKKLTQDASNLAVFKSGKTQIKRGSDLVNDLMKNRVNKQGQWKDWVMTDNGNGGDPTFIQLSAPDGRKITIRYDRGVQASKGLVGWMAEANAGTTQADIQYWLGHTANKGSTGTQNRTAGTEE